MQYLKGRYSSVFLCLILAFAIWVGPTEGGVPEVSDVMVTDITTRSFSVIWNSSEPSTAILDVFDGPDCLTPTTVAVIIPHPIHSGDDTIRISAENNGVMKVQITGLEPVTEYCFQTITTSISTSEDIVSPITPIKITTETQITTTYFVDPNILPFTNDIIYFPIHAPDQTTPIDGGILVVDVIGLSSSPVTGFVGDGIESPYTLLDLKNLFARVDLENINLVGNERIKLLEYRGIEGCTLERYRKVPLDMELSEVKEPGFCFDPADLDCNDTINILDILRDIGGFDTETGDFCFNSDLDLDGNEMVNILDILNVVGKFGTSR